jgi:hypothetical protein
MIWTPFDLISLVTSSPAAKKAERDGIVATLVLLRTGLAAASAGSSSASAGRSQFVNAASDLFCHQRVSDAGRRGQLDGLSTRVEVALASLQSGSLNAQEAAALSAIIDSAIASL